MYSETMLLLQIDGIYGTCIAYCMIKVTKFVAAGFLVYVHDAPKHLWLVQETKNTEHRTSSLFVFLESEQPLNQIADGSCTSYM